MRPIKPQEQRRPPSSARASPTFRGPVSKPQARPSSQLRPLANGVRYVDIRVAVQEKTSVQDAVGYFQSPTKSNPSPLTVSSIGSTNTMAGRGCRSPFGFIPIPRDDGGLQRFTPPISPFELRKSLYSPSMMSTISDDTEETASMTLDTSSRMGSPYLYRAVTPLSRASPRPRTPTGRQTPPGRQSPYQMNDDDNVRKTRVKTEMCMHYVNNRPCPFGANCTYAHGEEELQMTKLLDLEEAGLIDLDKYRTKPCLAWVMTGSCPFGSRCTSIHDRRVSGTSPSWLTHTETQGNTIATDINVESLHQKRSNEIHSGTPFGHQFSLEHDGFSDLYKLICNLNYARGGWIDAQRRPQQQLDPIIKIQIALKMRGTADWYFKFRPKYMIHDEMCMVLRHRGFKIEGDTVFEIPLRDCKPHLMPNHIEVREIAFGPDSDETVRGVALWFNIDDDDVLECTAAQSKRYRWKRNINKKDEKDKAKSSIFDQLDSFEMIRPHDNAAFDLATDILKHRLTVLQAERITSMRSRFEELKELDVEKKLLQRRFHDLKRHWNLWAWPVNDGREKVDKNTHVPKVDGKYEFRKWTFDDEGVDKENEEDCRIKMGIDSRNIWLSFVNHNFDADVSATPAVFTTNRSGSRLPVFQHLATGQEVAIDRTLPLICDIDEYKMRKKEKKCVEKDKCWRALLLEPENDQDVNEWDLVRDHFENSRSNKVISIIQSKSSTSAPPGLRCM